MGDRTHTPDPDRSVQLLERYADRSRPPTPRVYAVTGVALGVAIALFGVLPAAWGAMVVAVLAAIGVGYDRWLLRRHDVPKLQHLPAPPAARAAGADRRHRRGTDTTAAHTRRDRFRARGGSNHLGDRRRAAPRHRWADRRSARPCVSGRTPRRRTRPRSTPRSGNAGSSTRPVTLTAPSGRATPSRGWPPGWPCRPSADRCRHPRRRTSAVAPQTRAPTRQVDAATCGAIDTIDREVPFVASSQAAIPANKVAAAIAAMAPRAKTFQAGGPTCWGTATYNQQVAGQSSEAKAITTTPASTEPNDMT